MRPSASVHATGECMKRKRRQRTRSAELDRSLARAVEWYQHGQLDRAEALFRQILSVAPNHADAWYLLGTLHYQQGRHQPAVDCLQTALRRYRRSPSPALVAAGFNLGNACFELGRYQDAVAAYREALAAAPGDVELFNNLANALSADGRAGEAVEYYRQGLTLQPRHTGLWRNLAEALRKDNQLPAAIEACRASLRLEPDDTRTACHLAELLQATGQDRAAADQYRNVLEHQPACTEAHFGLGVCLQRLGHFEEAVSCLSRAVELRPDLAEAHYNLATNRQFRPDAGYIARLEALSENDTLADETRARMHFALGHLFDQGTDTDRAFHHFRSGNRLKARRSRFDPHAHTTYIDRLIDAFDAEGFERRRDFGLADERPVFIVGMPRSGTTLVEQILASHPAFHGAGELDTLPRLVGKLPAWIGSERPFPECLDRLDADGSRQLARHYLDRLPDIDPRIRRIGDKLPGNYARLGLIALLLPRARVIHVRRDPLDTCLSCYFHDFARGQRFSYDLDHLAGVYRDYQRLMAHWRAVLPLELLEVDYERLVRKPESSIRTMLSFCELDWDERCLDFHRNARSVATASFWQVRQPLYAGAIGRWQRYRKHLQPLIDRFEQHDIRQCTDVNS